MKKDSVGIVSVFCLSFLCAPARAQLPWPGEPWKSSTNLTSLEPTDWKTNLSGAFWNPVKRELWTVDNTGMFYRLKEGGNLGFMIDTAGGKAGKWTCGGDAEGITQGDLNENSVFVMNENGFIEEYETSVNGVVKKLHSWDIRPMAAPVGGSGPEGIAFVPDDWLRAEGFTDKNGKRYTSVNGMGGLFFVAHQNGGFLYVFDCSRATNTFVHVGTYSTGRAESSDLAFDRSIGALYIWHNIGSNSIEVANLSSKASGSGRAMNVLKEFAGPKTGNLEGMALTPASSHENWYFATDDDDQDGYALMWYHTFKPGVCNTGNAADTSGQAMLVDCSTGVRALAGRASEHRSLPNFFDGRMIEFRIPDAAGLGPSAVTANGGVLNRSTNSCR